MTCEEFERVVTDLACEFLIEAAARKRALAHARACVRCAARLRHERALTTALNETAATETRQAPVRMKTALLAAFEQQMTPADMAAPPLSFNQSPRRQPRWLTAAAAALLFVAILVALQVLRQSWGTAPPVNPQAPTLAGSLPPKDAAAQMTGDVSRPSRDSLTTKKEDAQPATRNDKTSNAIKVPRRRYRPIPRPELASHRMTPAETVTEFIPLTAIADATSISSGTIVRVEMPRASLIALGLPMNAERALERVKADIVVGDDGLARAIRLVY